MWTSTGGVDTYSTNEIRDPLAAAVDPERGVVYVLLRCLELLVWALSTPRFTGSGHTRGVMICFVLAPRQSIENEDSGIGSKSLFEPRRSAHAYRSFSWASDHRSTKRRIFGGVLYSGPRQSFEWDQKVGFFGLIWSLFGFKNQTIWIRVIFCGNKDQNKV